MIKMKKITKQTNNLEEKKNFEYHNVYLIKLV